MTRKTAYGKTQTITVLIWNPTVANLTLMALGSSAPEIMLAVLEGCLTLGRAPGELGPSTIVGTFRIRLITSFCRHTFKARRITAEPANATTS